MSDRKVNRDSRDARVYLADEVGPDRAAQEAQLLKEAGATSVTRDSDAHWFGKRADPVVDAWLKAHKRIRDAEAAQEARLAADRVESVMRYGY